MSWHYLQVREEGSSEVCCADFTHELPSRLTSIAEEFYLLGNATGLYRSSRCGTTSQHLTEHPGDTRSTSSPGDSRVKTSARQVKVKDCPGHVRDWYSKCCELLTKCGLSLSSRKTVRYCEHVDSAPSSRNLTAWGMMQDGVCWELGTSVHPIEGAGCGYLPTPTCSDATMVNREGGSIGLYLDKTGKYRRRMPTGRSASLGLGRMAKYGLWPTPTAHNAKECNAPAESNRNTPTPAAQVGGRLSPMWVEWLMGWPIGWTDLKRLAMGKFRMWPHWHGDF
jgi:hypothetical protein